MYTVFIVTVIFPLFASDELTNRVTN